MIDIDEDEQFRPPKVTNLKEDVRGGLILEKK